ncbi:helix-turn-helix domain-containing protein [Tropicimonas sp.]|uniref:helix-turn-helix domain-containing protein n=1 Tax=Tropicimonas sp. TaxID=2067044 RepID=UPI003A8A1682
MPAIPAVPDGPLRLVQLQHLASGGKWRTEAMRSYRTPLLLWFTRGQGRITVSGVTRGYGPHNAIFIPGGTMHGFEVASKVFGTAIFFAEPTADLPAEPCHLRIRQTRYQSELNGLVESLRQEAEGDRPDKERAIAHYGGLVAVWMARQRILAAAQPAESDEQGLARRYTEAIESQLHAGRSLADYAEYLGVAPTRLSEICCRTCGRPAADLLADRLAFEARRLLLDESLSVDQVSELLGYPSRGDFDRDFGAQAGESPGQFRDRRTVPDAAPRAG